MRIVSEVMNGGIIPDRFGKRGEDFNERGMPTRSVPFSIEDAPEGTVSYAFVLDDADAVPVCGFVWIHWLAANVHKTVFEENDSVGATDYVQGVNSCFGAEGKEISIGYGGMAPPNEPHTYTLKVYALDTDLPLKEGFFYNELLHAMDGHILAEATAKGIYNN